jgi:hypothetical protein
MMAVPYGLFLPGFMTCSTLNVRNVAINTGRFGKR